MPKSLIIDPQKERKSGIIQISDIPINTYKSDPKKLELFSYKD